MRQRSIGLIIIALFIAGCASGGGPYIKVDTSAFSRIGMVTFQVENAEGILDEMATDIAMGQMKQYLTGKELVKLGKKEDLFPSGTGSGPGENELASFCRNQGLDALFLGKITVSGIKPRMKVRSLMERSRISTEFTMTAELRFINGSTGKDIWTGDSKKQGNASYDHFARNINPVFIVSDHDESYVRFVRKLIYFLTEDFRR